MKRNTELSLKAGEPEPAAEETVGTGIGEDRIKCPHCGWSPKAQDRWMCGCRHIWNTFDTGGVCPKCLRQWMDTQCPGCGQWAPHSEWYPKN